MALETLPAEHRHIFVDKIVAAALDGGNRVTVLAEKFSVAHEQGVCTPETFERGLFPIVALVDDMSIDEPKTYGWLARLMYAARLDKPKVEEMAGKITVLEEPKVQPKDVLVREFDKMSA